MNIETTPKKSKLFFSLAILTIFLVFAEMSFIIQFSATYRLGDFKLIASQLSSPLLVLPGILYFVFAQFVVHFMFLLGVFLLARGFGTALRWPMHYIERTGIVIWFIALITVILANRQFFPNSRFSTLIFANLNAQIIYYSLAVCLFCLAVIGLIASYGLLRMGCRHAKKTLLVLVILAIGSVVSFFHAPVVTDGATQKQPNIILIGVDALRPDFLGFFGNTEQTPHFDRFLNHATVFSESLTPLARTYPSWMSILTSVYPKISGIRTNLMDASHADLSNTLPALLQKQGYHTIFATDDTRFSNIDRRYGFDVSAAPPIGVNDFLLGTINDFPLSNLVINTRLGSYLFPYSYANRAVFATYEPDSFVQRLRLVLGQPRTKPAFLLVHFCLPHYPYAWASLPQKTVTTSHYQAAVERVDGQFYELMRILKKNKLLEHSIVVLLSDHGEAVEMPGDRITDADLFIAGKHENKKKIPQFYPPNAANEKVNMSGGHGTDVLGLSQYHTVLAFRSFGLSRATQEKVVPGLVSVMDIKPTLLAYLKLPLTNLSGLSLTDIVFGKKAVANEEHDFFTETDLSPKAIRSVHPEPHKVLFEGIEYFRIDPKTARVVVKENMMATIIAHKQYADYYGSWVLALYPQEKGAMIPILVNLETGQWTNDLTIPFAKQSPAKHMLVALKRFFKNDINL